MRSILRTPALIDTWFDTLRPEQRPLAEAIRHAVLRAAPSLTSSIKWGNLLFSRGGDHALAIVIHKEHAHLQVFNGARLVERFPMLEGAGRGVRHLRLRYRAPLDEGLVEALVRACIDDLVARGPLRAERDQ